MKSVAPRVAPVAKRPRSRGAEARLHDRPATARLFAAWPIHRKAERLRRARELLTPMGERRVARLRASLLTLPTREVGVLER
jgi:hypothetical protein